ncbi:hypothetical protein EDD59_1522 [Muricomes intestini]|jgi:hypothetical protein|uniref:Uncharacterized protein n=1 Tax=Muricomes intestini TaxID=1796634 RepID=A0A4R3JYN4_9FIRM|nr:hypothetical protein EDD59_1522 [Muricomes intestini]
MQTTAEIGVKIAQARKLKNFSQTDLTAKWRTVFLKG